MKWLRTVRRAPGRSVDTKAAQAALVERVKEVLEFERFYSRRLNQALTALKIREVNAVELAIFHELLDWPRTPAWFAWRLGLDRGYVSRTLAYLAACGFIEMHPRTEDRREREVTLTRWGRIAALDLEEFQEARVRGILEELPRWQQKRLARSMRAIVEIFRRGDYVNFVERLAENDEA